jgi:hypothetical protein
VVVYLSTRSVGRESSWDGADFTEGPEPELTGKMRKWVLDISDSAKPPIASVHD